MSFLVKRIGSLNSVAETMGFVAAGLVLIVLTIAPVRAAQVNVVAVGASATAGKRLRLEAADPAWLESMLRAKGYDVGIRNEGISGHPSRYDVEN